MNSEKFVKGVVENISEPAVLGMIEVLTEVPGRAPRKKKVEQSEWYHTLTDKDKDILKGVIKESVDSALFSLLCVLDGAGDVVDNQWGEFELKYRLEGDKTLINDAENEALHDIYNWYTNPGD